MNVIYKYLIVFIIGFLLGCMVTCSALEDETPIEIIVPEEKGEFVINPKEKEIEYRDSIIYKNKIITIESPINKELYNNFVKAQDSLEQLKVFLNAITVREYQDSISDSNIRLDYYVKTTGTLDDFKLDYTIKEKKIEVPSKVEKNNLYYGGGIYSNGDNLNLKGGLMLRTKSNQIYSLEYGTDKNLYFSTFFSF